MNTCRTNCPIVGGGWCPTHDIHKYKRWVELCIERDNYFAAWEEGRGPGQQREVLGLPQRKKPGGAGTELHKLLQKIGLREREGCKCKSHVNQMDREGIVWCRAHVDTIVGWLKEEAKRRGLPFVRPLAKRIVMWAIRNAEQVAQQNRG